MSRHRLSTGGILLTVGIGVVMAATVRAEDIRTWADATGRFELRAKLVSVEGGNAILLREDGQKMTIAVDKLSKADQEYLANRSAESPFQPVEASPFTPMPANPAPVTAAPARPAMGGEPRIIAVNWAASETVALAPVDTEWKITPPVTPSFDFRPKSVALPKKIDFFEKMSGMAVNMVAKKAVVGYSLAKHGSSATSRILMCDIERGRVVEIGTGAGQMAPIALHDNGKHVVMRRDEFGMGNLDRLEVWAVSGTEIARSMVWTPYDDAKGADRDVMWAEFVDSATLATCSRGGILALWNISTMQPLCHLQLSNTSVPAISADRKWIAFCTAERVGLFDIAKREVAASAETPERLQWPFAAFSPSGSKIGCIAFNRILAWDTATGALEKNFSPAGIGIHGAIDFPDDGYILANKQFLVALESQIKLWQYRGAEHVRTVGKTTFLAAPGFNTPGMLAAVRVPHPEAVELLERAKNQADIFVFRKGTPVKLNVSGIAEPHRTRVSEALTKKLAVMNCTIQANAPVEVAAGVEGPKEKEISFWHSGDYKVKEYRTWLKFLYQGKPMWESSGTNIGFIVTIKKGENLESVLRKASEQPAYGFYESVTLPEFLQKPSETQGQHAGGNQTLGASTVTDGG